MEKTLTFNFEDALISPKGLAILSGADLIQADGDKTKVIAHTTETVVVSAENKIVLSKKPVEGYDTYIMLLDGNGEMSGIPVKLAAVSDARLSEKEITLGTEAQKLFKADDVVMVDYYVEYAQDAMQIDITPDKFGGYYYLEASTLFRRQSDGVDLPAEFVIPKIKIQSNFTFTMASSGDPSSFSFVADAFPDYTVSNPTKKVLASIQILDADDNFDLSSNETESETKYERFNYNQDGGDYISTADAPLTADDNALDKVKVTFKIVNGQWSDKTKNDIIKRVAKGTNVDTIAPKGMLNTGGTSASGTWNPEATGTVSEDKVFTYTVS